MPPPCFKIEKPFPEPIVGVDEAGRGPLAGPVVAAAVVLDRKRCPRGIDDSKKLCLEVRESLYGKLAQVARVGGSWPTMRASIPVMAGRPTGDTARPNIIGRWTGSASPRSTAGASRRSGSMNWLCEPVPRRKPGPRFQRQTGPRHSPEGANALGLSLSRHTTSY